MVIRRMKGNSCGVQLPGGLTGTSKKAKEVEAKNDNAKPPKRGKGSQETK